MDKSKLIIGPSFKLNRPAEQEIKEFSSHLSDPGALEIFNIWLSKVAEQIPHKTDMSPTLFPKLLPQVAIEEYTPEADGSKMRLAGEFYKEIYSSETLSDDTYYNRIPQDDIVSDWVKSDRHVYEHHSPTVHFFDLFSLGREYIKLAELCMPIRTNDGSHQGLGYLWRLSENEEFPA